MSEPIPYRNEVVRKSIHLLALIVPLGMAWLGKEAALVVLVPLALAAVGADVLRVRSAGFAGLIRRLFGALMRREEQPPVGGPVVINGATWVLVSATVLAFVFPVRLAVAAFAMFILSDAAAALIGRRWGRHAWGHGPRTVEGSLAFVVAGLAVMALFPGIVLWAGALSVAGAAVVEALPLPFNDNVHVPLVAAAVLFVLERWVLVRDVALFLG